MAAPLLSPELRSFCAQRYVAAGKTPSELAVELKSDFGVSVTSAQLRQFLSRSGLAARKREVSEKVCTLVSTAQANKIAHARAEAPVKHLERWAGKAVEMADRAIDSAAQSGRPRDLASAISAASTAVRLFRSCAGIEDTPRAPFDYDFGSRVFPLVSGFRPPVTVLAPDAVTQVETAE